MSLVLREVHREVKGSYWVPMEKSEGTWGVFKRSVGDCKKLVGLKGSLRTGRGEGWLRNIRKELWVSVGVLAVIGMKRVSYGKN